MFKYTSFTCGMEWYLTQHFLWLFGIFCQVQKYSICKSAKFGNITNRTLRTGLQNTSDLHHIYKTQSIFHLIYKLFSFDDFSDFFIPCLLTYLWIWLIVENKHVWRTFLNRGKINCSRVRVRISFTWYIADPSLWTQYPQCSTISASFTTACVLFTQYRVWLFYCCWERYKVTWFKQIIQYLPILIEYVLYQTGYKQRIIFIYKSC